MKRANDTEKNRQRGGWPARTPKPGERVAMSFRVTPECKAKIDEAARRSGRSLMQEIELRLDRSLEEERQLADVLELGFGRQIAGLMLAIGCVMKEIGQPRPTRRYPDWLSNPKAFRVVAESINQWLEAIDPAAQPRVEARLRRILDEGPREAADEPLNFAAVVAAGLVEPEESGIDLGPLASTIRGWLGGAVIARLRDGLALPPSPSE
jgi:hypothetical protein